MARLEVGDRVIYTGTTIQFLKQAQAIVVLEYRPSIEFEAPNGIVRRCLRWVVKVEAITRRGDKARLWSDAEDFVKVSDQ